MRCERIARVVPPPRVVPRPLARAPNVSLSTRAFSDRARGSRRASNHITVRPVRARTRPSRAIESRATHSLYFFHARHRAKSPSSRDAPFSSPPDDDRTIDPRAYRAKRTTADYRSIDRGKTRRARIPRPLSRGDERVSLVPLARRVRRSRPTPRRRALPRARGTAADPRARISARGADGDRPTDPTDPTDRVGGRGWDGYVLGS